MNVPNGFIEERASSDGVSLHCVAAGARDGELVVLLHGFPARWSTWRRPMMGLARAGFFAVAFDQRGYGASDKPEGVRSYTAPKLAFDVTSVIRHFGRERAHVVGHDFGGGVAWATAMFHPEVVSRLAIVNSIHPVGFERQIRHFSQIRKSWYVFFFLLPRVPEWYLARDGHRFLKRALTADGLSDDDADDLLEGVRDPAALRAAVDWYRASFRGARPKLRTVDCPTLVIWGDRETHLDAALAYPPSDWVSNASTVHVPEAGHWVHHQAPERVVELLTRHFEFRAQEAV